MYNYKVFVPPPGHPVKWDATNTKQLFLYHYNTFCVLRGLSLIMHDKEPIMRPKINVI